MDYQRFDTRKAALRGVGDYIAQFHNVERRHSALGYLSPMEYELRPHARLRVALLSANPK